jgi:hypothetical protein
MIIKYKNIIKINLYILFSIFLIMTLLNPVVALDTTEAINELEESQFGLRSVAGQSGFMTESTVSTVDLAKRAGQIIGMLLSLLGVLFLVLLTMGGFKWMTARGNEEESKKAKDILFNATVGIIIVFSAYAISSYIINELTKAITE